MTKTEIRIIDRGRGPQLSTSRITVQDLVPYLQRQYSCQQILEIMPALTVEEIHAVQEYVRDNHAAVMEQDRRIRARAAARRQPPEIEAAERAARLERLQKARQRIHQQNQERNGDHPAG